MYIYIYMCIYIYIYIQSRCKYVYVYPLYICSLIANVAHTRQSRPNFSLGFQVKLLEMFQAVPSLLGAIARALDRDILTT